MTKYRVILHGSGTLLRDDASGKAQLGGFYVNCFVEASDKASAGNIALDEIYRHPKYLALESWPTRDHAGPPPITVDSIDKVPFWRRSVALGITTGFIFYVDPDVQPKDPPDTAGTR